MRLFRICFYMLFVLMLAACGGESDTAADKTQTTDTETTEEEIEGAEPTEEEASLTDTPDKALAFAGKATAHEGTLEIIEAINQNGKTLEQQQIKSVYKQNEMVGSEEDGYQLQYEKEVSINDGEAIKSAFYRQPTVASYMYYGPNNYWHATDYSQLDESIEQRLDFMSPYDALMLYKTYEDEAELLFLEDGELALGFTVDVDRMSEFNLDLQYMEPESLYYTSEYSFDFESVDVVLEFDIGESLLKAIVVTVSYRDTNDETITLFVQSRQDYDSYMLTDVIYPPNEAFENSDLWLWDFE